MSVISTETSQLKSLSKITINSSIPLPVFSTEEEANRYAQWRSDTMFDAEAIAEGFEIQAEGEAQTASIDFEE